MMMEMDQFLIGGIEYILFDFFDSDCNVHEEMIELNGIQEIRTVEANAEVITSKMIFANCNFTNQEINKSVEIIRRTNNIQELFTVATCKLTKFIKNEMNMHAIYMKRIFIRMCSVISNNFEENRRNLIKQIIDYNAEVVKVITNPKVEIWKQNDCNLCQIENNQSQLLLMMNERGSLLTFLNCATENNKKISE
jgi:Cu2+-containing amine oxidase